MDVTAVPTPHASRRGSAWLAVAAFAALHVTAANAGMLYSIEFNDITSASISANQYQTGNWLVFNATFANADRSGFNAIHALQRSGTVQGGAGDYAVMIYGNNVVTQKTGFAGANSTGVTYYASYYIGPTVYSTPSQATQAGDTFVVSLLRADNSVLASNAVAPGAWPGTQTFSQAYFSYVGDGSGPLRLQLSSGNTQTRFVGAIDNMAIWDTVPVPEPSTCALALAGVACGVFGLRRRTRQLRNEEHRMHRSKWLVGGLIAVVATCAATARADFMYVTNGGQGPSFVAQYTTSGSYVGQFTNNLNNPAGIAQDLDGNYYVVNNSGNNYSKFQPDGTFISSVSTNLSAPQGITVDRFGNVYVSEGSGTVEKFNSAGTWQMQFPASGTGYSIANAQGLGIDAAGTLYVADSSSNNQVVMLNSVTGAYITRISSNLTLPHGVVRDQSGFLYVSNATANTVSKFNPDYTFNSTISGGMSFPIGIGLDSSGNLFVSNNGNNTLTKYDTSGSLIQTISGNLAGTRWLAFKPYAVPEPSTCAMALAGLTYGGYSIWRRRKRA